MLVAAADAGGVGDIGDGHRCRRVGGGAVAELSVDVLAPASDPTGGEGGTGVREAAGAVSYTHLRAHETVLDLVCRLLLEKKNNKDTQTLVLYKLAHIT